MKYLSAAEPPFKVFENSVNTLFGDVQELSSRISEAHKQLESKGLDKDKQGSRLLEKAVEILEWVQGYQKYLQTTTKLVKLLPVMQPWELFEEKEPWEDLEEELGAREIKQRRREVDKFDKIIQKFEESERPKYPGKYTENYYEEVKRLRDKFVRYLKYNRETLGLKETEDLEALGKRFLERKKLIAAIRMLAIHKIAALPEEIVQQWKSLIGPITGIAQKIKGLEETYKQLQQAWAPEKYKKNLKMLKGLMDGQGEDSLGFMQYSKTVADKVQKLVTNPLEEATEEEKAQLDAIQEKAEANQTSAIAVGNSVEELIKAIYTKYDELKESGKVTDEVDASYRELLKLLRERQKLDTAAAKKEAELPEGEEKAKLQAVRQSAFDAFKMEVGLFINKLGTEEEAKVSNEKYEELYELTIPTIEEKEKREDSPETKQLREELSKLFETTRIDKDTQDKMVSVLNENPEATKEVQEVLKQIGVIRKSLSRFAISPSDAVQKIFEITKIEVPPQKEKDELTRLKKMTKDFELFFKNDLISILDSRNLTRQINEVAESAKIDEQKLKAVLAKFQETALKSIGNVFIVLLKDLDRTRQFFTGDVTVQQTIKNNIITATLKMWSTIQPELLRLVTGTTEEVVAQVKLRKLSAQADDEVANVLRNYVNKAKLDKALKDTFKRTIDKYRRK